MNGPRGERHDDHERRPTRVPDRRRDRAGEVFEPPRRRREELSPILYWLRHLKEWGWILSALAFVWVAIGFKTSGPGERLAKVEEREDELSTRVDSNAAATQRLIRSAVDSITRTIAPTAKRTDALARYRCIHIVPDEAYLLDLDCPTLLPGYPNFSGRRPASPDDEDPPTPRSVVPSVNRLRALRQGVTLRAGRVASGGPGAGDRLESAPAVPPARGPSIAALAVPFLASSRVRITDIVEDAR